MNRKSSQFCVLFFLITSALFAQTINLGIIMDFPTGDERQDKIKPILLEEIQKTIGRSRQVVLKPSHVLSSNWNAETAQKHYKMLSGHCDLIIVVGALSTKGVLESNYFPKPTIALGIYDTGIQNIPYTEAGTSGITNFSYILNSKNLDNEFQTFHEIAPFKKLALLAFKNTATAFDISRGKKKIAEMKSAMGFEVLPVFIEKDIDASLQNIPQDIDAAYLAITYELNPDQIEKIADYLIKQKIPSFSVSNRHINLGIMASISSENDIEQIIRKVAIMADGAINGENLADMKVAINQKDDLYFNQTTARKINFTPPFKVLFTANIVKTDTVSSENIYSIEEIIQKGLEENLNIKISAKDMELSEQDIKYAYSNFLPDADLSASAVWIDANRTSSLTGQAEQTVSGTGSIRQLIFSEEAIANIKIQKLLAKAQKYNPRQAVQDITLDNYAAYFSILQAKTNMAMQRENLTLSKKNLELSKLRLSVGAASNADVYRWESEVANASQSLIVAQTNLILTKLSLNNQLNGVLPEQFDIKDARIEDDVFIDFSSSNFGKFVQRPNELRLITDFMVEEALRVQPTKNQLLANLKAVERQLTMYKRTYYLPTLALQGQMDEVLWRGGNGSDPMPGQSFNNSTWNVALNLSYPLFDGNRRHINVQKGKIQKDQLSLQIKELDNALALNIRAKALQLLTAMTNIEFAKISAENAVKSLELVQNAYKQGANSLTDLLNAQQAALQAKLGHSNSVYNYLISFLELEGSVGYLHMLATEEEKEGFRERLNQFIMENINKQ